MMSFKVFTFKVNTLNDVDLRIRMLLIAFFFFQLLKLFIIVKVFTSPRIPGKSRSLGHALMHMRKSTNFVRGIMERDRRLVVR